MDGISAPFVISRPIYGVILRTYVARVFAPMLIPGDIVILDNLGSRKGAETYRLIEARDAQLVWLPPYSHDLDPIERRFVRFDLSEYSTNNYGETVAPDLRFHAVEENALQHAGNEYCRYVDGIEICL